MPATMPELGQGTNQEVAAVIAMVRHVMPLITVPALIVTVGLNSSYQSTRSTKVRVVKKGTQFVSRTWGPAHAGMTQL